jgi:hypothetical protein
MKILKFESYLGKPRTKSHDRDRDNFHCRNGAVHVSNTNSSPPTPASERVAYEHLCSLPKARRLNPPHDALNSFVARRIYFLNITLASSKLASGATWQLRS